MQTPSSPDRQPGLNQQPEQNQADIQPLRRTARKNRWAIFAVAGMLLSGGCRAPSDLELARQDDRHEAVERANREELEAIGRAFRLRKSLLQKGSQLYEAGKLDEAAANAQEVRRLDRAITRAFRAAAAGDNRQELETSMATIAARAGVNMPAGSRSGSAETPQPQPVEEPLPPSFSDLDGDQ